MMSTSGNPTELSTYCRLDETSLLTLYLHLDDLQYVILQSIPKKWTIKISAKNTQGHDKLLEEQYGILQKVFS